MKKTFAVLCVFLILLSLCACKDKGGRSGKKAEDEKYGVVIESSEEKFEKDFEDRNGEKIARLEITYPVIRCDEAPGIAEQINNWFNLLLERETESIGINIENTEDYKDRLGIDGVTVTRIKCEQYGLGNTFVSYTVFKQVGVNPDEDEGTMYGRTFSLADGKQLWMRDIFRPEVKEPEEKLKQAVLEEADQTYSVRGGIPLSDEQREVMNSLYDEQNFCFTGENITIPYSFKVLSKGSRHGIYYCAIDYAIVEDLITGPDEYYDNIKNIVIADDSILNPVV